MEATAAAATADADERIAAIEASAAAAATAAADDRAAMETSTAAAAASFEAALQDSAEGAAALVGPWMTKSKKHGPITSSGLRSERSERFDPSL
jgi:hypothetical protein